MPLWNKLLISQVIKVSCISTTLSFLFLFVSAWEFVTDKNSNPREKCDHMSPKNTKVIVQEIPYNSSLHQSHPFKKQIPKTNKQKDRNTHTHTHIIILGYGKVLWSKIKWSRAIRQRLFPVAL